jgi:hypothetical protein
VREFGPRMVCTKCGMVGANQDHRNNQCFGDAAVLHGVSDTRAIDTAV